MLDFTTFYSFFNQLFVESKPMVVFPPFNQSRKLPAEAVIFPEDETYLLKRYIKCFIQKDCEDTLEKMRYGISVNVTLFEEIPCEIDFCLDTTLIQSLWSHEIVTNSRREVFTITSPVCHMKSTC